MRFKITSRGERGRPAVRRCDDVVEAWNWFAYFTCKDPLAEVEIVDRQQDVEARA